MNLSFFEKIGLFLALFERSYTGNTCYKTEPQFFVTSVAITRALKNSSIPLKKCQIHANSNVKGKVESFITNSDSTFLMYIKICLHCHLLRFS